VSGADHELKEVRADEPKSAEKKNKKKNPEYLAHV
jgi:hypothetical protein